MSEDIRMYENLKEVANTCKTNCILSDRDFITQHREEMDNGSEEIREFIYKEYKNIQKNKNKNIKKIEEAYNILSLWLFNQEGL